MDTSDQLVCVLDAAWNVDSLVQPVGIEQPLLSKTHYQQLDERVILYALRMNKSLASLTQYDFLQDSVLAVYADQYQQVIAAVTHRMHEKIKAGMQQVAGQTILHTAPHHDDIILGYHAYVMRLLENNENHFVYLTNGSNGVADDYILDVLHCASADQQIVSLSIFKHDYFYFIEQFAVAFHAQDTDMMQQVRYQIFFKIFVQVFGCQTEADLDRKVFEVLEFFAGKLNAIEAQQVSILIDYLKGRLRQSESDSKWMIAQGHCRNVYHFGAQFYLYGESLATLQDQIIEQDVQRFVEHLRKVQPQIVTVALDPCGVGPSTHFTTLQVIAKALQRYGDETIQFIGYRNVWSCFSVTQASLMVPVTADDMEQMEKVFLNCFATQKDPLHPSPLHEGTFSDVSRQFQEHQMQDVQLLLGDQFEDIRVTRGDSLTKPSVKTGMIFLQKLTLHDLQKIAMEVARK